MDADSAAYRRGCRRMDDRLPHKRQPDEQTEKLVLLIFGTRPEAIKMAPVVHECRRQAERIETIVCVTGQHREMLDQVTDYFGITADRDLELMTPEPDAGRGDRPLPHGLDAPGEYRPDCMVAQGDTTTVMAAALAAFYRRVPFVHVEAGLRTGNLQSPWPEELNRRIASLATTLHFARPAARPKTSGRKASARVDSRDRQYGDRRPAVDRGPRARAGQRRGGAKYAATGRPPHGPDHRPPPRELRRRHGTDLLAPSRALAQRFPRRRVPLSGTSEPERPRAGRPAALGPSEHPPLRAGAYPEFVWLMDRSTLILTDSGGVQEEAPSLASRCW